MIEAKRNWGKHGLLLMGLSVMIMSAGCGGKMPEDLGVKAGALSPCPDSPNCVSSFATDEGHAIAALSLLGPGEAAWTELGALLGAREDVEIVRSEEGYLHAVFTTPLMRYRDDVEFLLVPGVNGGSAEIAVRSASRVGYGDMGANRDRVEAIREALVEKGLVRSA